MCSGYPDIEEIQFSRGQPLQFAATIETAPEFELPEYKGLPVKREARTVTDEDVERALEVLARAAGEFQDGRTPGADRRHRGGQLHRHVRGQTDHRNRARPPRADRAEEFLGGDAAATRSSPVSRNSSSAPRRATNGP